MRYTVSLFLLFICQEAALCQQGSVKPKVISLTKDTTSRETDIPFVFVQGGSFNFNHSLSNPGRIVKVNSFYIGKYEITQAQWKAVMHTRANPYVICDNCPVTNVSWDQVQEFIITLNQEINDKYRLPTEAEWEFAAKGGILSKHYTYSGGNDLNEVAWYKDNSGGQTHPVGRKRPNELGIFDMTGNADEWCSDWDSSSFLFKDDKIYRGGDFVCSASSPDQTLHFNSNGRASPSSEFGTLGFRLVRDYP